MMTPEEQRIAIAEHLGWKKEHDFSAFLKRTPADKLYFNTFDLPDYLNDLNAIHEAEMSSLTTTEEQDMFLDALYTVIIAPVEVEYGSVKLDENGVRWIFIHATAPQRCEAFLRTIGQWKD